MIRAEREADMPATRDPFGDDGGIIVPKELKRLQASG